MAIRCLLNSRPQVSLFAMSREEKLLPINLSTRRVKRTRSYTET